MGSRIESLRIETRATYVIKNLDWINYAVVLEEAQPTKL